MDDAMLNAALDATTSRVRARRLSGFDDLDCSWDCWDRLLAQSDTDVVCLTRHWLQAWWETVGQGDLLLIAAERGGEIVCLAPLFALEGMVFFLGAGESDYLDFIGEVHDPDVISALLSSAREATPGFVGFKLHLIPDRSRTGTGLRMAAERLGMDCFEEAELLAVEVDLETQPLAVHEAVNGRMRDRENYCRRRGHLEIRRFREHKAISECLAEFYSQHESRWQAKGLPSQFSDPGQRAFLERFLHLASATDWIRFVRIDWNARAIAFEFAWYYRGAHYSGPWCFDVENAKQSPGQILLRNSILAAIEDGIATYDLGTGDQDYKLRLPARTHVCRTWGLYPP